MGALTCFVARLYPLCGFERVASLRKLCVVSLEDTTQVPREKMAPPSCR